MNCYLCVAYNIILDTIMIIVADCGTTKCDWAIADGTDVKFLNGTGFNPVHADEDYIYRCTHETLNNIDATNVEAVYFYGAGCLPGEPSQRVENVLKKMLPNAIITVNDDLTGAATALFKNDDGIACILGTGSNAGLYKKGKIVKKIPSMGYILGDEGSGASLGRRLLNAMYKSDFSEQHREMFERECMVNYNDIINGVYRSDKPAAFLAKFVPFIKEHISDAMFRNLVFCEFDLFFVKNIIRIDNYKSYNIGFVGSVAAHFKEILDDVARFYSLTVTDTLQRPIERLAEYHIQNCQ